MKEKSSIYEFIKYMEKESAIKNIICAINLKFFRNMHRDGKFIYSEVNYEGRGYKVVFDNPRQIEEVLYKLANHLIV